MNKIFEWAVHKETEVNNRLKKEKKNATSNLPTLVISLQTEFVLSSKRPKSEPLVSTWREGNP